MRECNLRSNCEKAKACKTPCQAFIALHGLNNKGGKQLDSMIPFEYRQTTIETAKCRNNQANIYNQLGGFTREDGKKIPGYIKSFKKAFNEERNSKENRLKDLYLWSRECGLGKTETASMLANEFLTYSYMRSIMLDEPSSFTNPVAFIDVPQLQELYLKANRGNTPKDIAEDASREYYRRLSKAKKSNFVVLDEMAVRSASEAFVTDMHEIINHRTVNNMTTIFTSNLPLEEMKGIYGERIYDRIRNYCIEYNFVGTSKRGDWR